MDCRPKGQSLSYKTHRRKYRLNLSDFGLVKDFFGTKNTSNKRKMNKLYFTKI